MLLNKKMVDFARQNIEKKREYWEKKLNVKFDADGRVNMGVLSSFDENDWRQVVLANISEEFCECFLEGLEQLGLQKFNLRSLTYEDYKKKRVTVTTTKGRVQEKNIAALLQKAHNVWETKYDLYRPYRNHIKQIRNEDGPYEIGKLNDILKRLEAGNTYIAYDRLLREFQEKSLLISINPLDKIFSSGGTGHGFEDTITKFSSCWSNRIIKRNDDSYEISAYGGFSNPRAQVTLGSHLCSGMVMISNGNVIEVDGMKFFGMLQRSHIWLDCEGIFIENIYPDKYNEKRIEEITEILSQKAKVISPSRWKKVSINETDLEQIEFDSQKWFDTMKSNVSNGRPIYLDRSAINHDNGEIWIGPNFRYYNHGGNMWLPGNI